MKQIYLIAISIFFFQISFSAPVIQAVANGNWNNTAIWDLNRLPKEGDTVVIPSTKVVTVNDDEVVNGFSYLKIYGKLGFLNNNSTLKLGTTAIVIVYSNGHIVGGGSASQKLRIGTNTVFDGNDAPVNGPRMATSTTGFQAFAAAPLPVKFVGFTAVRKTSGDVLVQWSTSEELNADRYEVERSYDGSNWNMIAYVAAIGNSSALNNYAFTDKNAVVRTVYYRVKQVDVDGRSSYTSVNVIKTDAKGAEVSIASVQNKVLLQFPQEVKGGIVVRFVSFSGQVVDEQTITHAIGQVVLNSKVKGNYVISVSNGQDLNVARQVIL